MWASMLAALGVDQACCVIILRKWGRLLGSVGASIVWDSLETGHTSGACMSLRHPVPLSLRPFYSPVSRQVIPYALGPHRPPDI